MMNGLLQGLLVGLSIVAIGLFVAFTSRRSYVKRSRPSCLLSIESERPPQEAHELIVGVAKPGTYKLEEDQSEHHLVTLSSNPTLFSWGFYFPIYMEAGEGTRTKITIGIESKLYQYGPVVTHHHKKCETAVKVALAR